jgi:hypothetical protein
MNTLKLDESGKNFPFFWSVAFIPDNCLIGKAKNRPIAVLTRADFEEFPDD